MTPKEKAEELVDKCLYTENEYKEHTDYTQAIQCALIAVDEILNNDGFTRFDQYLTEFWQEVKKEIEQL